MKLQLLKIKNKKGFVLLFAVILSSIILSVALGIANIAYKEIRFSTSAKDTNNAFFAADTGIECALFNDKSTVNKFPIAGPASSITCAGTNFIPLYSGDATTGIYVFTLSNLGGSSVSCVKINIIKTATPATTKMVAKGYNDGGGVAGTCTQGPNSVERELDVSY